LIKLSIPVTLARLSVIVVRPDPAPWTWIFLVIVSIPAHPAEPAGIITVSPSLAEFTAAVTSVSDGVLAVRTAALPDSGDAKRRNKAQEALPSHPNDLIAVLSIRQNTMILSPD
jgi:hypothetical protein